MEFIICNEKGEEVTLLTDGRYIDMEIGDSNSFYIEISKDYQKRWGIDSGWWIGCPGKEYGGIIDKVVSSDNVITISGSTWRGMLTKKILQPPSGEDYLSVSGDADSIINNVICSEFSGIFVCDTLSGVQYSGYKFDRYVNSLAGIEKMLFSKNLKLSIEYDSGEPNGKSFVRIKSTPIHDFSDEIEYSKDGTLSYIYFSFEKFTGGINHLICLGKGELKDRLVLHLYADENGNIGTEQHFFGADEREATYDYSSAGTEEDLRKNGTEKFKELLSYKSMDMDLFNETLAGLRGINDDISIGDIVGGRDFDTGIYLSKQITRKIVQVKNGRESIEYGVGKPVLNRNSANAPVEQQSYLQGSDVVDNLLSTAANLPLSAKQGKSLQDQITALNSNLKLSLKKNSLDSKDANDYREQGIYNIGNTDSSWSNLPTGVTTAIIVVIENYRRTQLLLANNGIYYRYIANPNLSFKGVLWGMLSAKNYTIKYPTDMFSESQCLCERSGNVITVYVSLKASKDISSGTVISLTGTPNTPKSQYFSVLSRGGNIVSVRTYSGNIEFSVNATIKTDTWIGFQLTYVCTN